MPLALVTGMAARPVRPYEQTGAGGSARTSPGQVLRRWRMRRRGPAAAGSACTHVTERLPRAFHCGTLLCQEQRQRTGREEEAAFVHGPERVVHRPPHEP
ncbi:hypothetical protein GCM10023238_37190 [Streptomyces heliomycini]